MALTATDTKHFQYWMAFMVFALVNLCSLLNSFEDGLTSKDWNREQKFVVSVASINFALGTIACFGHLFVKGFAGTFMEFGTLFVVFILWCASLAFLMDGEHELGTNDMGILNGNIYFSGWLSFIMAVMLITSHLQMYSGFQHHETFFTWSGFTVSSLVVLSASVTLWQDQCDALEDSKRCSRTMFGIVLGAICALLGIGMMFQNDKVAEQYGSIVLFIAWCFGISYITFDSGPGVRVGTLYFSTWFCMICTLFVASSSVRTWWDDRLTARASVPPVPVGKDEEVGGDDKAAAAAVDKEEEEVEEAPAKSDEA